MQKLFVCHNSRFDDEVTALSQELSLIGVPLWLDHSGGFDAGDNMHSEARRIIRDSAESFGLLVYATPELFDPDRTFINRIEIPTALTRKDNDRDYLLMVLPRRVDFLKVSELFVKAHGIDPTVFHSRAIYDKDVEGINPLPLRPQFSVIARMILKTRLDQLYGAAEKRSILGISLCTRSKVAPLDDDVLELDGTRLFASDSVEKDPWGRLLAGMIDLRSELRKVTAKPRIRISGSKHLTTAFLIGRVFTPPVAAEVQTLQGTDVWSSECGFSDIEEQSIDTVVQDGSASTQALFVEISVTDHDIRPAVRACTAKSGITPFVTLRIEPHGGIRRGGVANNAVACKMASEIRAAIVKTMREYATSEIHLFMAVPQGLATLIGRQLGAVQPLHLYEYRDGSYQPSAVIRDSNVS